MDMDLNSDKQEREETLELHDSPLQVQEGDVSAQVIQLGMRHLSTAGGGVDDSLQQQEVAEYSSGMRGPAGEVDSLAQTTFQPANNILNGMPHSQLNQMLTEALPSGSADAYSSNGGTVDPRWPSNQGATVGGKSTRQAASSPTEPSAVESRAQPHRHALSLNDTIANQQIRPNGLPSGMKRAQIEDAAGHSQIQRTTPLQKDDVQMGDDHARGNSSAVLRPSREADMTVLTSSYLQNLQYQQNQVNQMGPGGTIPEPTIQPPESRLLIVTTGNMSSDEALGLVQATPDASDVGQDGGIATDKEQMSNTKRQTQGFQIINGNLQAFGDTNKRPTPQSALGNENQYTVNVWRLNGRASAQNDFINDKVSEVQRLGLSKDMQTWEPRQYSLHQVKTLTKYNLSQRELMYKQRLKRTGMKNISASIRQAANRDQPASQQLSEQNMAKRDAVQKYKVKPLTGNGPRHHQQRLISGQAVPATLQADDHTLNQPFKNSAMVYSETLNYSHGGSQAPTHASKTGVSIQNFIQQNKLLEMVKNADYAPRETTDVQNTFSDNVKVSDQISDQLKQASMQNHQQRFKDKKYCFDKSGDPVAKDLQGRGRSNLALNYGGAADPLKGHLSQINDDYQRLGDAHTVQQADQERKSYATINHDDEIVQSKLSASRQLHSNQRLLAGQNAARDPESMRTSAAKTANGHRRRLYSCRDLPHHIGQKIRRRRNLAGKKSIEGFLRLHDQWTRTTAAHQTVQSFEGLGQMGGGKGNLLADQRAQRRLSAQSGGVARKWSRPYQPNDHELQMGRLIDKVKISLTREGDYDHNWQVQRIDKASQGNQQHRGEDAADDDPNVLAEVEARTAAVQQAPHLRTEEIDDKDPQLAIDALQQDGQPANQIEGAAHQTQDQPSEGRRPHLDHSQMKKQSGQLSALARQDQDAKISSPPAIHKDQGSVGNTDPGPGRPSPAAGLVFRALSTFVPREHMDPSAKPSAPPGSSYSSQVSREIKNTMHQAAGKYAAENEMLKEIYKKAQAKRIEMNKKARSSIFDPSSAARILQNTADEKQKFARGGPGQLDRMQLNSSFPSQIAQERNTDLSQRINYVNPVSNRVLELDDLLANPQFHKGTISDQSKLQTQFKRIYNEQIKKKISNGQTTQDIVSTSNFELSSSSGQVCAVRNRNIVNPGGRKLAVLESAGVELPTEGAHAKAHRDAERRRRIQELDLQLAFHPPAVQPYEDSETCQSECSSVRRDFQMRKQLADYEDLLNANKYRMRIGPPQEAREQADAREDALKSPGASPRVTAFKNELSQVDDLPSLYRVLDAKIESKKRFDPLDAAKRREVCQEQQELSRTYLKFQAYDFYKLVRGGDEVETDDLRYQEYLLDVFRYFPENPALNDAIPCGVKNRVRATAEAQEEEPGSRSARRLPRDQRLACTHEYGDDEELQRRYRLQLWFLNFHKYVYCLLCSAELAAWALSDVEDIDGEAIAHTEGQLARARAAIVGNPELQSKKLLARGAQAAASLLRKLAREVAGEDLNESEKQLFGDYQKVKNLLQSPLLKLVVVERPQAFVDYKLAGNIADEAEQQDILRVGGDLEPYLHDLALKVIRRCRAQVMEVKKRRYVTFKNVDDDHAMHFSALESKRILENLRAEADAKNGAIEEELVQKTAPGVGEFSSQLLENEEMVGPLEPSDDRILGSGGQAEARGGRVGLELTEKDIVKQLVYLVNEKKNAELVGLCEKQKDEMDPGIAKAFQEARARLSRKQAAAHRKQAMQQQSGTAVAMPAKSEAELLSEALPSKVKATLYKQYRQKQLGGGKQASLAKRAMHLEDRTGKALFIDFMTAVAGAKLSGQSPEGQDLDELRGRFDHDVVKRLGDQVGSDSKSRIREVVLDMADDKVPLLFKHMRPGCIYFNEVSLTLEHCIETKQVLQVLGAVEKTNSWRSKTAEMESLRIRTLIIDNCNASDEAFEQVLLGVEAQHHIKNIHYSNHNHLGPKATAVLRRICARRGSDHLVELNLTNIRVARPALLTRVVKAAKQEAQLEKTQAPPSEEEDAKVEATGYLAEIIQELEDTRRVKRLKLADLDLNDEASVQNIIDILQSNGGLTYINLASSNVKLANLVRISAEFRQCAQLEYLNLGGNRVDAGLSGATEERLRGSEEPQAARSAGLLQAFLKNICELLESAYSKLRHIDLSNMGLKREHLRVVLRSLRKNTVLQSVNLGHLECLEDIEMVRDVLNIEEARSAPVAGPSEFLTGTIQAKVRATTTFKSAYLNNSLRRKLMKDGQMAQNTLFDRAAHLLCSAEQPLLLNRSSQHGELVFNRFSPFCFDSRLSWKWFMVRDCSYCQRHRYTLVYFNQRSPASNDFQLLEGQEPLIQMIEQQASLAEAATTEPGDGGGVASQAIGRRDPMIIAGGHLYQMVDPIVFASHVCMQDIQTVLQDQLDRAKQPQGALDVTQFDVDCAALGPRELQKQRRYDEWLAELGEADIRRSLCEIATEVTTAESLLASGSTQQKIACNFESTNWERMLEGSLLSPATREHVLVVNQQPQEHHRNVEEALEQFCPSERSASSEGSQEQVHGQELQPQAPDPVVLEKEREKSDDLQYCGPSLTSPAVYIYAGYLPPGPNAIIIVDRVNEKVYSKEILVEPAGARQGLLGGDWTSGLEDHASPPARITEEEAQRIDRQHELDIEAERLEEEQAQKMPRELRRTNSEQFMWQDEPETEIEMIPSGAQPKKLIMLPRDHLAVDDATLEAAPPGVHPLSDLCAVNPKTVPAPMNSLLSATWAWHFASKRIGPQQRPEYEDFTDAQCLVLEYCYQKYEKLARARAQKKTDNDKTPKPEQQTSEHQIFPLDERYLIDLKFMVMYRQSDPNQWYPIFRTQNNTRLSSCSLRPGSFFEPGSGAAAGLQLLLNPSRPSTLQALPGRTAADPMPEKEKATGLLPYSYRGVYARNGVCKVPRESLRNQLGKKYVRDNKKRMPSLNQLIGSFVGVHYKQMKDRLDSEGAGGGRPTLLDIMQMEEAVQRLREATARAFSGSWESVVDRNKPIDIKVLQQEPEHPVVKAALYLFAMGGETLRSQLLRACREQDLRLLKLVGPFAAVLGEIARSAEGYRVDYKKPPSGPSEDEEFTAYCGLSMKASEIQGIRCILDDMKMCQDAHERDKGPDGASGGGGRKASKPYDQTLHTYHLEGFLLASLDRDLAELSAIRAAAQAQDDRPLPVLLVLNVQKSKDGTSAGIRLNRVEYISRLTCSPEELRTRSDTILFPDGSDTLLEGMEEVFSTKYETNITVIRLKQINDWSKKK